MAAVTTFARFDLNGGMDDTKAVVQLVSHFVQPVGLFEGTIELDGRTHAVKDVPGVTEDQDILW